MFDVFCKSSLFLPLFLPLLPILFWCFGVGRKHDRHSPFACTHLLLCAAAVISVAQPWLSVSVRSLHLLPHHPAAPIVDVRPVRSRLFVCVSDSVRSVSQIRPLLSVRPVVSMSSPFWPSVLRPFLSLFGGVAVLVVVQSLLGPLRLLMSGHSPAYPTARIAVRRCHRLLRFSAALSSSSAPSLFGVHVPSFGCCHCRGCAFRISSLSLFGSVRPSSHCLPIVCLVCPSVWSPVRPI